MTKQERLKFLAELFRAVDELTNVQRQLVPERWAYEGKRSTTGAFLPVRLPIQCWNNEITVCCGAETAAASYRADRNAQLLEICWSAAREAATHQLADLEINPRMNRQPVKLCSYRFRDMVVLSDAKD